MTDEKDPQKEIDRLRQENRLKYRYQPLDKAIFFISNTENPEADSIFEAYGQYVRVALAQLPPGQREVLTMAYYFGMTQTEIAAQLSLPLGTIKSRIRYGLMQVKQALLQVKPLETSISSIFNVRLQR